MFTDEQLKAQQANHQAVQRQLRHMKEQMETESMDTTLAGPRQTQR